MEAEGGKLKTKKIPDVHIPYLCGYFITYLFILFYLFINLFYLLLIIYIILYIIVVASWL